jgi:archaellum component FlaC
VATIIKVNQGKSSLLDAIAWALGGNKFKPSQAARVGSVTPPHLSITMNNGLIVERKGKNSELKVIDPRGGKGGQQLLNSFVEELAINLPKFIESTSKEKTNTLLQIIGVGQQLAELELSESELYNQRHTIGQIKDQKEKYAKEMTYFPDAPKELISVGELVNQQQTILAINGENQHKREQVNKIAASMERAGNDLARFNEQLQELNERIANNQKLYNDLAKDYEIAKTTALELHDQSTEKLEQNLSEIDEINRRIRTNLDKDKAEEDANEYKNQYDTLSAQIDTIRDKKANLLNSADLPLPGLSVLDGELTYNGQKWDNMSGSDQLKVSTAIVRKLKPDCGFILLDKLEQMDMSTLEEFGDWLEKEGLQAIATRVSTGEECSIIIEDGYVTENKLVPEKPKTSENGWSGKGAF